MSRGAKSCWLGCLPGRLEPLCRNPPCPRATHSPGYSPFHWKALRDACTGILDVPQQPPSSGTGQTKGRSSSSPTLSGSISERCASPLPEESSGPPSCLQGGASWRLELEPSPSSSPSPASCLQSSQPRFWKPGGAQARGPHAQGGQPVQPDRPASPPSSAVLSLGSVGRAGVTSRGQ